MYKLTYMCCDFNTKDRNGNKNFDEASFQKYIDSPVFKKAVRGRTLYGAISHLARDKFQEYRRNSPVCSVTNQSDFLLANNLAASVITDSYIKDHKLYVTVQTLPYGAGLVLEKLIELGTDLQVSMSTELDMDDQQYYIVNLYGIDHTLVPAFGTSLIKKEKVVA